MGDRSPTSPRHLPRGSPPVTPGREATFSVDAEGSPITPRRAPPRTSGPLSKVTPVPSADMPTINKVRPERLRTASWTSNRAFRAPIASFARFHTHSCIP